MHVCIYFDSNADLVENNLKFPAPDIPADFLDAPQDITTPKSVEENHSKKFHKIDLNRTETVNDDKTSQFKTSTTEIEIKSTTEPFSTSSVIPAIKTTTSIIPFDESSTEGVQTTTEVNTSTSKSSNIVPAPGYRHHPLTWVLGKLFRSSLNHFISFLQQKDYLTN